MVQKNRGKHPFIKGETLDELKINRATPPTDVPVFLVYTLKNN